MKKIYLFTVLLLFLFSDFATSEISQTQDYYIKPSKKLKTIVRKTKHMLKASNKTSGYIKTPDNVRIAYDFYESPSDEVLIIAPGWCMTKDSAAFRQISEAFAEKIDVITFDFRGHGQSEGKFNFTSSEVSDFDAIISYAREKKYDKINLLGFSLGGGMALIEAAKNPNLDKIIAVSPYTDFDKIENHMWKVAAWNETIKKFELERFMTLRMGHLKDDKVKPIDVVENIKEPVLFIAGEKDPTVYTWHTVLLYKMAKCPKMLKIFEDGYHAEDLFLYYKDDFMKICFDWLFSDEMYVL